MSNVRTTATPIAEPMQHTWHSHPRHWQLHGHTDAVVLKRHFPAGYLWQYRKRYGHAASLAVAREWVEALAEHYSIPARQRWITI